MWNLRRLTRRATGSSGGDTLDAEDAGGSEETPDEPAPADPVETEEIPE